MTTFDRPTEAGGSPVPFAHRQPRDFVEDRIATIWEELLGRQVSSADADFFELGGTSLLAARCVAAVNEAFATELALDNLYSAPSLEQFARSVRLRPDAVVAPRIVHIGGDLEAPRVYCVHAQSGEVFFLRPFRTHADSFSVWGIRSVGLDGRESPLRTVDAMAERYTRDVLQLQPHGPYFLSGYCMGGVIAYEMARRLQDLGEEVAMVATFDTSLRADGRNPLAGSAGPWDLESVKRRSAIEIISRLSSSRPVQDPLPDEDDGDFWPAVLSRVASLGRVPPDAPEVFLAGLEVASWNTIAAVEHVLSRSALQVDVYDCTDSWATTSERLAAWRAFAGGGVDLVEVETDHFDFFRSGRLLAALKERVRDGVARPAAGSHAVNTTLSGS